MTAAPDSHDKSTLGLYLHFPYCRHRCSYCDFNAHLMPEQPQAAFGEYHQALLEDVRAQGPAVVDTVFWGGGTPSLMPLPALTEIVRALDERYTWTEGLEHTIEVNPGTVDEGGFADYLELGINRISLGAQSFHAEHLTRVGRIHSAEDIEETFRAARRAGFTNLSLDLIYGFPEQTVEQWKESLERSLALEPQHLSVYHLTVEPSTLLEKQLARKELELPPDEEREEMDDLAQELLEAAGFERYEVSNWCRPGYPCHHNIKYWRDDPYLGLGCGAVSFIDGWRVHRIKAPLYYQRAIAAGRSPVTMAERMGTDGALKDALMMGLRVREGVSTSELCQRFPGLEPAQLEQFFARLPGHWWKREGDRLSLTRAGWDFHSEVTMELLGVVFSFL